MFVHKLVRRIAREFEIVHYSMNYRRDRRQISRSSWKDVIERCHAPACFGPIRQQQLAPIFPSRLDDYQILLHLRDPRDVLTSNVLFDRI